MTWASLSVAALLAPACLAGSGPVVRPEASIEVRDRHGIVLRNILTDEKVLCRPIGLEDVSPWMILATLAAEDKRFFQHPGIDLKAIGRALWQDAKAGRPVSGGSTISQQLARALQPTPRTMLGKIGQTINALILERRFGKMEILDSYLNTIPFGNNAQGIEAAAQTYFGIPARDMSLAQAALLAGIPKSPSRYDPLRYPARCGARRDKILERMRRWGWIDDETYRMSKSEAIKITTLRRPMLAPQFTELIRRQANGTVMTATIDSDVQELLQSLLSSHLVRLKANHVTNAALIALDNASGEVIAWVGSSNFKDTENQGQVDGVLALRQPGSALKPFAFGAALARGMKASDLLEDLPVHFPDGFSPKNYDESYHGLVRLREALACSYNVAAARVAARLGVNVLLATMRMFGFESLIEAPGYYGLGLVLGNGEVTLLELANAYAALARGGVWMPVRTVRQSDPGAGKSAAAAFPGPAAEVPRRVLDRESAYIITHILSDNAARAGAFGLNSPFHMPFQFAAKTGTTKDYRDNWAVGYTPDWTVGVWVGNFDGTPMRRVSGISGAAPLLHDAALVMSSRYGARDFAVPIGIREVGICPVSGDLPAPGCPSVIHELFSAKNLPRNTCRIHPDLAGTEVRAVHSALAVENPGSGDIFKIDPAAPRASQVILLRSSLPEGAEGIWEVDGEVLPERGNQAWWRLMPGRHHVKVSAVRDGLTAFSRSVAFLVVP